MHRHPLAIDMSNVVQGLLGTALYGYEYFHVYLDDVVSFTSAIEEEALF